MHLPPLLDIYNHSSEPTERQQRPTLRILSPNGLALGIFSQGHASMMPTFQTNESRDMKGLRRSTLYPSEGRTSTGVTLQFMNIYQFTDSNPVGQTEMRNTTENWTFKQEKDRIILQGDLNSAHLGCRGTMHKDIGTADNKLEHFLSSTGGHSHTQQEHTWKGKGCQAALDHVVTWNYHLPSHIARPNPKSHKKFDHYQIWTQLPHMDFPKQANPARTTPLDFCQRIDTVFFKRHTDDWKVRIKKRILG